MGLIHGSEQKLRDLLARKPQAKVSAALAQRQWQSAIAALEQLLLARAARGVVWSFPTTIFSHPKLVQNFTTVLLSEPEGNRRENNSLPLPSTDLSQTQSGEILHFVLPDCVPRFDEQFCLVFTPDFAVVMVLDEADKLASSFHFSFAPEVILAVINFVRSRLGSNPHLNNLLGQFKVSPPDYQLLSDFSHQLLTNLPEPAAAAKVSAPPYLDIELLQALGHEIRTPLTTIRTMTRLLLKRTASLTADVIKCLEVIDLECSEQINRMELILKATEIESNARQSQALQLVPTDLEQVFAQSIPQWKKQAKRRNVQLDFILPQILPSVTSDPRMLDQMLTGLLEKCTRNVPPGGHIQVQVTTAGPQLKVQVYSQAPCPTNPLKALGQLLMFQPETGSISLNLDVTKNLFHALGGKLVVRQRPQEGEIMTVFLPLEQ